MSGWDEAATASSLFALESSCDETAVARFRADRGLTGEWIHSQIALHERHGGVVPDLAAREHLRHVGPLVERAGREAPDLVAVTYGPGLAPCLALGVAAAKALALAWHRPLVGVNHLRGHVWSVFIPVHAADPAGFAARAETLFPHLALIVSGGHTLLAAVQADRTIRVISSTRDDAAGEALDKGAKLLGLGYPGGPLIERTALGGDAAAFDFPRGLPRKGELDFSFSGLKTALRYTLEKMSEEEARARLPDLCASYQQAVIDALATKAKQALKEGAFKSLGLSGGVARNAPLRRRLEAEAAKARAAFLPVNPDHSGDNAAMIAFAAWMDPNGTHRAGMALEIVPSLGLD